MSVVRSRVAIAIIGAVVIGGASGSLGVLYAAQGTAVAYQSATSAPISTETSTGQTAHISPSATATLATTTSPPVTSSNPTATTGPTGQQVDLHGVIGSVTVSSNSFALNQTNGSALVVNVSAGTQYQGDATSLSSLRSGWRAEVVGVLLADGNVAGTMVNADSGR